MNTSVEQKKAPPLENSDDAHSLVSEPDEAQKRYAALRNHQIRFCDAIDPNAKRVYDIKERDILLGRGRGFQDHPGNRRMRGIVEKYKIRYHSLTRTLKKKLIQKAYMEIIQSGARFLKKLGKEDGWVVVDSPIAFQKISHTMRCRKSVHRQMDASGHIPEGVGGPVLQTKKPPPVPQVAMTLGGQYHHALNFLGGGNEVPPPSAVMDPMTASAPSSLSTVALDIPHSTAGLLPPLNTTLEGLRGSLGTSLNVIEARHLAAQERLRSITNMRRQSQMDYYELMKKEQIIREIRTYSRMGDEILLRNGVPLNLRLGDLPPRYSLN